MTTFKDVFKRSFLDGFAGSAIDLKSLAAALIATALIALYIFAAYRILTRKTFYSKNFNISIVGVAIITAAIIVTIQSSVVISLGMVGALSIVRFRTAIKDPMDLMFLFWAISTGIICGAGFAEYAVVLAIILTVLIVLLNRVPAARAPMILVVNADDIDAEGRILEAVKKNTKYYSVKSRSMTSTALDMTVEVRTADGGALVRETMAVDSVRTASLISHDGEVSF